MAITENEKRGAVYPRIDMPRRVVLVIVMRFP